MRAPCRSAKERFRGRGIATLWLVLTLVIILAFFAMVVDVGWVVLVGHQLSAGADAAALAGAMELRRSLGDARDEAVAMAASNFSAGDAIALRRNDPNDPSGDIVLGHFFLADRVFAAVPPATGEVNAIHVNAPRTDDSLGGPVDALFGSIFGFNSWSVERNATAMILGDIGPGVIALNPTDPCSLNFRGTSGVFSVENGAIYVNSASATAACHSGQPTLEVSEVYTVGQTDKKFEDQVDLNGELITGSDPVPDPLAALPEPHEPGLAPSAVESGGVITHYPGTYPDGLEIGNGTHVFEAGLYYFEGEFKYTGGNVDATAGVMLFIAPGGSIDVSGNGTFHLVGMNPTTYPNGPAVPAEVADIPVPIFQSRSNYTTAELGNGTADWMIGGTVYIPEAQVLVRGTPGTFSNGLIADQIEVRGTTDLTIDYEDQFPPIPRTVFLVQ